MENDFDFNELYKSLNEDEKKMFDELFNQLMNDIKTKFHGLPNPVTLLSAISNAKNEQEKRNYTILLMYLLLKHNNSNASDGKTHLYEVATRCGGVMEDPEIHYENYQYITANSKEEAEKIYNDKNNCRYYYGQVIRIVE